MPLTLPVSPELLFLTEPILLACYPKLVFGGDKQKISKRGEFEWTAELLVRFRGEQSSSTIKVTLRTSDASTSPAVGIPEDSPVRLDGLRAGSYVKGEKDTEWWWVADGLTAAVPSKKAGSQ